MVIPFFWILLGLLFALAYFARSRITYTAGKGTKGSVAIAIVVFGVGALIGWGLDVWTDWSVIPQYMVAAGGTLQIIAWIFYIVFAGLCVSMLISTMKCGRMVA